MYIVRDFYQGSLGYQSIQQAVGISYFEHYGASPQHSPDVFTCLSNLSGDMPGYACVGISYGDSKKLFSEYYLDDRLDDRYVVDRMRIAEIGAFASFQEGWGAGKYLLANVIRTLAHRNFGLVVLTATKQVRRLLLPIVDNLEDLGGAYHARVKDPRTNWGSYYEQDPRVVVSRLSSPAVWQPPPAHAFDVLPPCLISQATA